MGDKDNSSPSTTPTTTSSLKAAPVNNTGDEADRGPVNLTGPNGTRVTTTPEAAEVLAGQGWT